MVKLVPYWGLAVIATTVAFLVPLIYTSNQELIDEQINHASELINSQTAQVRDVASKQMEQVSAISKQYAGDYTHKVQDLLNGKTTSRQKIEKPEQSVPAVNEPAFTVKPQFPTPPTEEPLKADAFDSRIQSNSFNSSIKDDSFESPIKTEIPASPAFDLPEVPSGPSLGGDKTAAETAAPEVPEEPVVTGKQPMSAS